MEDKKSNKSIRQVNYRKLFAVQNDLEQILKKACPNISHKSGIYFYTRTDGYKHFAYIGLAQDLLKRNLDHLHGYKQRIDVSIKKRGFYSENNLSGWKLNVLEFAENDLEEKEKYYIELYKNAGQELYNIECGGKTNKTDINERKLGKGYYDGLKQGKINSQRLIAHLFDKHLDCVYKGNREPNKHQLKAMAKFKEFIDIEKGESNENNQ